MKALSLILILLSLTQNANSGIFSASRRGFVDPREPLSRSENSAYNSIGYITSKGITKDGKTLTLAGTAFLINECLAFTNQHVVFAKLNAALFTPQEIKFQIQGLVDVTAKVIKYGNIPYVGQKLKLGTPEHHMHVTSDWAIIKLDSPIKNKSYIKPVFIDHPHVGAKYVSIASYFIDKPDSIGGQNLYIQRKCGIYHEPDRYVDENGFFKESPQYRGPYIWAHDCASIAGTSGSPIFEVQPNGEIHAYGISSRGVSHTKGVDFMVIMDDTYNEMTPFSGMTITPNLDKSKAVFFTEANLKKIIRDNPCK